MAVTNSDLAEKIGYVTGVVEGLQRALVEKNEHDVDARRKTYERIEAMAVDLGVVKVAVGEVKDKVDTKVMPAVADMEGIKRFGGMSLGAAGVAGASLFAAAVANWGMIWGAVVGFIKSHF